MPRRLVSILALAASCSTPEAGTASLAVGPSPRTVRLVGTISGAGAGARVTAQGKSATAGSNGSYQLDGLDEGGTVVVASAAGQHDEIAVAALTPPETRVDLTLTPTAGSLELVITGDVAFTSRGRVLPGDEAGWTALAAPAAPLTRSADVTVVPLESVLDTPGMPHPSRPLLLASPPASAAALKALGADVVMLATDHIYDYLDEGVLDTLDNLRAAGITALGAGADETAARATTVVERNGVRVGLCAFSLLTGRGEELAAPEPPFFDAHGGKAGANRYDVRQLDAAVADLRGRADQVVVLLHGGHERDLEPAASVATAAHRAIDAGADLVVVSHPRAVQGVERYRDKLVFYSLGGFAFDDDEPAGWSGVVLRARLPKSGPPTLRLDPVYLEGTAPAAAAAALRQRILGAVAERSATLGVTVLSDGRVLPTAPADVTGDASSGERSAPVLSGEGATLALDDLVGRERYLTRVALVTPPDASLWLGRNVLDTGDVEDELADGVFGAPAGFSFPSTSEQIVAGPSGSGRLSIDICRSGTAQSTASARSAGRYPTGKNATVSLCGCWRGDAGTTGAARVLFYDSLADDAAALDSRDLVSGPPPTDWTCFCHAAAGPAKSRYVELRLEHTPSADHTACVGFDALKLILWEPQDARAVTLGALGRTSFVRVTGAAGSPEATISYDLRTLRP